MSLADTLLDDLALAIGEAQGYSSKQVRRRAFRSAAIAAAKVMRRTLEEHLEFDEDDVIEAIDAALAAAEEKVG